MPANSQTNLLLGHSADARLLIINADDFGMCHSVNQAVFDLFQDGIITSTTLMVPCPWMLQAMHFRADHPDIPFGIHLTAISDWSDYRWEPVTYKEKILTLIDDAGYFYNFENTAKLSQEANDVIEEEGIILMDYRPLQDIWRKR